MQNVRTKDHFQPMMLPIPIEKVELPQGDESFVVYVCILTIRQTDENCQSKQNLHKPICEIINSVTRVRSANIAQSEFCFL